MENETIHKHRIDTYKSKFLIHNLISDRIGFIVACAKDGYTKEEINLILTSLNLKLLTDEDKEEVRNRLNKEHNNKEVMPI
jgi:hypothetical protein